MLLRSQLVRHQFGRNPERLDVRWLQAQIIGFRANDLEEIHVDDDKRSCASYDVITADDICSSHDVSYDWHTQDLVSERRGRS